ncbi:hypothetical protein OIA45_49100 (plasmid) [Streptomyces chartreusis]|uniref:hypothetical protein n=1 Tax=Streptomyces chartreusis TaxID=1969 RepID=UPI0037DD3B5E|nr:hypothetical protein OIA45_49100 [Streptomyces chartreusis]
MFGIGKSSTPGKVGRPAKRGETPNRQGLPAPARTTGKPPAKSRPPRGQQTT